MKCYILLVVFVLCLGNLFSVKPTFPKDPAISPDGTKVCFAWNNDLFIVPFIGGTAVRLTSGKGEESMPAFSPDGKWIAYTGNKNGYSSIYIIPAEGGEARELAATNLTLWSWFPDSKRLLVSDPVYTKAYLSFDTENGRMEQVAGLAADFADVSSSGMNIIYCTSGDPYRKRYQGSLNGDLWEIDLSTQEYRRLTNTPYTERYPVYSKTKVSTIYYCRPVGNQFQLFKASTDSMEEAIQLTSLKDFSARDLSIAWSSDRLVFEYLNHIYSWDEETHQAKQIEIDIKEDLFSDLPSIKLYSNNIGSFQVSPDGKWMLFSQDSNLFYSSIPFSEVKQLTFNHPILAGFLVLPDNVHYLMATRGREGCSLTKFNITDLHDEEKIPWDSGRNIKGLSVCSDNLVEVKYSERNKPDRVVYFDKNVRKIVFTIDNDSVTDGLFSRDGKRFFYFNEGYGRNLTLKYRELGKSESSFLASYSNTSQKSLASDNDGKVLFVNMDNIIISYDIAELINNKDEYLTNGNVIIKSDGFVYLVDIIGNDVFYLKENKGILELHKADFFGQNDMRISENRFDSMIYMKGLKRIYVKQGAKLFLADLREDKLEPYTISYKSIIDQTTMHSRIFEQIWSIFKQEYYDPSMRGLDWNQLYDVYSPLLNDVRSDDDLCYLVDELLGDLNSSHTGFYPKSTTNNNRDVALIGLELNYYTKRDIGIEIKGVFKQGELARKYHAKPGDVLLSMNNIELKPNSNLHPYLTDAIGEQIRFSMLQNGNIIRGEITGLTYAEFLDLQYRDKINTRKIMVNSLSQGKIGYIHIKGMNDEGFENFQKELADAKNINQALIIDVRDNGGGWTHYRILDELLRQTELYQVSASLDYGYWGEPVNAFAIPKVLLINQNCASATEAFAHIFRRRHLGQIIGVCTQGAVIGTGQTSLIDGSVLLTPMQGVFTSPSILSDMDGMGVQPDIVIEQTPPHVINGLDVQLEKAVSELLKDME